jgi:hypothetical protein
MAIAKVEEYASIGELGGPALIQAPQGQPLRTQTVTFTGTSAITALALKDETRLIVISTDTDAYFRLTFVSDAAADSTDPFLFAGSYRPLAIVGTRDQYVAFVTK